MGAKISDAMMNRNVASVTGESVVRTTEAATKLSPQMSATVTAAATPARLESSIEPTDALNTYIFFGKFNIQVYSLWLNQFTCVR
jgi:hypothetical protein